MERKRYFLGLDIGTDSVGYAVTDKAYSLLKFHGEPMWGVTLFDQAELNTDRRAYRAARRRLDRRQQRIDLLQELYAPAIQSIDDRFFIRLQNSAMNRKDTEDGGSLFDGEEYSDQDYHRQYPTIHHLICELMTSDRPHDVRLVYLGCAWLIAHRGHFLNDIDADHIDEVCDFQRVYLDFEDCFSVFGDDVTIPWKQDVDTLEKLQNVLKSKNTISGKYREISMVIFGTPKVPKDAEPFPVDLESVWKMICGSKTDAKKLFRKEEYAEIESFALDTDDEKIAAVLAQLEDDDARVVVCAKALFDWALLANSLSGCRSVSESKVRIYEQHKEDLRYLKTFVRRYLPEKFDEIFRFAGKDNYVAYSYHYKNNGKAIPAQKAKKEDFSKYLLGIVSKVTPEEGDMEKWEDMKQRLELHTFLPKQRDTDNRVIPHQLYLWELNEILSHAQNYLPFLSECDEKGLCVAEKIVAIFRFRVPYFVGPLNQHSKFAWIRFKAEKADRILPWNYADIVDEDASEEAFIRRMTNKCTYLPGANVLPKDSLLYHRFTVLNEINNLTIDGKKISVEVKQGIYEELFAKKRKVTRKMIENYLLSVNAMQKGQSLGGIDEAVKSDLKPWHDFANLLKSGRLTEEQVERIIERRTYSDDRMRFVKWLKANYSELPEDDVQYIARLNYKDFGRLSREFLTGLFGTYQNDRTGEAFSIIQAMWETNFNLMELLSDRFSFGETVKEIRNAYYDAETVALSEQLNEMYISNAVKRPVIRSLEIVKEIVKAVGSAPEKIFVEMTRGGKPEGKGKRTKSRREQILELYEKCRDEDVRLLRKELDEMGEDADSRLQGDRLFLYYMQLGKCMYTGARIDVSKLKDGTYNIEHIYPQAYVKDDSIINNEVLVLSEVNGQKSDSYPISGEIREKMHGFWSALHRSGLVSDEKYKRLTRSTPFSDEEKIGFINRQLTETSQSTKAVAELLRKAYPDTEIVYVKARLVSEFRQEFDLIKSRAYNDLHHAKDAYLNIVTGNVYDMKFSKRWFNVRQNYSIKTVTVFSRPVVCNGETVWNGKPMLEGVIKTVGKNNIHLTKYAFCCHGGLFARMPLKAATGLIPRKTGLPTEQYGGYSKPTISFFILVKYTIGKKNDIMVMPVELLCREEFFTNGREAEYAKRRIGNILGKTVDEVSFPLGMRIIKINTVLSFDGFKVSLSGVSNGGRRVIAAPFMPFVADRKWETYIKRLDAMTEKAKGNSNFAYHPEYDKVTAEENIALYDLYVEKLRDSIYAKRPNNPLQTLVMGRDKFLSLSPVEQAKALLNIHQVFGRISGGCDLTAVGGGGHAAATYISSNISNWRKAYKEVDILDSSATGFWTKKSGNLLELL